MWRSSLLVTHITHSRLTHHNPLMRSTFKTHPCRNHHYWQHTSHTHNSLMGKSSLQATHHIHNLLMWRSSLLVTHITLSQLAHVEIISTGNTHHTLHNSLMGKSSLPATNITFTTHSCGGHHREWSRNIQ